MITLWSIFNENINNNERIAFYGLFHSFLPTHSKPEYQGKPLCVGAWFLFDWYFTIISTITSELFCMVFVLVCLYPLLKNASMRGNLLHSFGTRTRSNHQWSWYFRWKPFYRFNRSNRTRRRRYHSSRSGFYRIWKPFYHTSRRFYAYENNTIAQEDSSIVKEEGSIAS